MGVRVAVIGAGLWGGNHVAALHGHPGCTVALVCDTNAERARRLAATCGAEFTTDIARVAAADVQAVTVATPDHLHAAPVLAMLDAGKHVLVEKPLATTVDEARAMVQAAERVDRVLMVDFHARWHPLYMGAKGYVERGELGRPVMAYARLSDTIHVPTQMLSWGSRSGPEWFLFPHTMDLIRWLFGTEPVEVYAKGTRGVLDGRGIPCWDTIQALVEFDGGATCTFETSWIVPDSFTNVVDNRITVYGERGGLEVKNEPALWAFTDRFHTPFASTSVTRYGKAWGYQYEPIRYFVDCVAAGRVPESTGHDGLVVTAMIAATLRSLEQRRAVRIDEVL